MTVEKQLCLSCMEEHPVQLIEIMEENIFKEKLVRYPARYAYCFNTDEYTAFDEMVEANDISLKDAYRKEAGLLTSKEIMAIREKFGVSQKDFSKILGWGSSTITRYENHQVQDIVHDDVLRKVNNDPKWFMELLERAGSELSKKAYEKYLGKAREAYHAIRGLYIKESLEALYARFESSSIITGNTKLNINKVVEVINYLAKNVEELHKVKLMKMLWFADFLHYKKEKKSITGLAYICLQMGAVPEGHDLLLHLDGIFYDEILYDENIGYKIKSSPDISFNDLSKSEKDVLDEVIRRYKLCTAKEIVTAMHREEAYKQTERLQPISYEHAESLSISL